VSCSSSLQCNTACTIKLRMPPRNANLDVPAFRTATMLRERPRCCPWLQFPSADQVALFPEVRQEVARFLAAEKGKARAHWPKLLRRAYPEFLPHDTLEDMLVQLVVRAFVARSWLQAERPAAMHDFIEFCSGIGNLTMECCSTWLRMPSI